MYFQSMRVRKKAPSSTPMAMRLILSSKTDSNNIVSIKTFLLLIIFNIFLTFLNTFVKFVLRVNVV